jgi:hypothetical protein
MRSEKAAREAQAEAQVAAASRDPLYARIAARAARSGRIPMLRSLINRGVELREALSSQREERERGREQNAQSSDWGPIPPDPPALSELTRLARELSDSFPREVYRSVERRRALQARLDLDSDVATAAVAAAAAATAVRSGQRQARDLLSHEHTHSGVLDACQESYSMDPSSVPASILRSVAISRHMNSIRSARQRAAEEAGGGGGGSRSLGRPVPVLRGQSWAGDDDDGTESARTLLRHSREMRRGWQEFAINDRPAGMEERHQGRVHSTSEWTPDVINQVMMTTASASARYDYAPLFVCSSLGS